MPTATPILSTGQFRYDAARRVLSAPADAFDNPAEVFGDSLRVRSSTSGRLLRFERVEPGRYSTTVDDKPVHIQITGLPMPQIPAAAQAKLDAPEPKSIVGRRLAERAARKTGRHGVVVARAGTGKTTTCCQGLYVLKGLKPTITPSAQQQAVWDLIMETPDAKTVAVVAFNVKIVEELIRKVPKGVDVKTNNGLGFGAVRRAFPKVKLNQYRVSNIVEELTGRSKHELDRHQPGLVAAVVRLVKLVKANLTGTDADSLTDLVDHYDIDLADLSAREVFPLVARVIERCKNVNADNACDFDDQVWLPVVLDLPVFRYDLLMVDEAQDLNRCQQALVRKAGRRLILVGDPKQAIYGFAGADADSMPRMIRELGETPEGVVTLPLNVTRRCGKAIVAEAQKIVPDFAAFESNCEGIISRAAFPTPYTTPAKDYRGKVEDGNMVLCRTNAPLVQQCFRFLRDGRKANILGREIGAGLIRTVEKLEAASLPDLIKKLDEWLDLEQRRENAKKNPSDDKLITLQDRYDCLVVFSEGAKSVEDVITKIQTVFSDESGKGVRLSSIHKAKGLEADRVFLLEPIRAPVPHPMAKSSWAIEQEWNLRYVAITRAIRELVYVVEKLEE
jgi:DNA helicase-2/ATP-dependent DNA helicase PcrA